MEQISIEVPERLRSRPLYKGYVVTFVTFVDKDGIPDFKMLDHENWLLCAQKRLCGLCGEEMYYWVNFIGGPASMNSRHFKDPPMHMECAEYAMKVCPFLIGDIDELSKFAKDRLGYHVHKDDSVLTKRPDEMGIGITRSYDITRERQFLYFKSAPWKEIRWYGKHGEYLRSEKQK